MENLQFYSSVKKSPSVAPADPAWGHLRTQQLRTGAARLPQTPTPTQRGRDDVSDSSQGKDDLQMCRTGAGEPGEKSAHSKLMMFRGTCQRRPNAVSLGQTLLLFALAHK